MGSLHSNVLLRSLNVASFNIGKVSGIVSTRNSIGTYSGIVLLFGRGGGGNETYPFEPDSVTFDKLERLPPLRSLNKVGLEQTVVMNKDVGDIDSFRAEIVRQH